MNVSSEFRKRLNINHHPISVFQTPFHTSEPLINKVRTLLKLAPNSDFGPITTDQTDHLTASLKGSHQYVGLN